MLINDLPFDISSYRVKIREHKTRMFSSFSMVESETHMGGKNFLVTNPEQQQAITGSSNLRDKLIF